MLRPRGLHLATLCRLLVNYRAAFSGDRPRHVFFCICDHYEPDVGGAPVGLQRDRVERWIREYPRAVAGIADSLGRPPQHTFFYPAETHRPEHLEQLTRLCRAGFGDVEVHLHHDNDTAENLRETLETHKRVLFDRHGLLRKTEAGDITYGFIHGNWALDNSRPDGRWCGVNNELTVLRETGCYADFTMPSAPSPTQTRTVNSIYYAIDDPDRPKSHDRGIPAAVGAAPPGDGLLMVQGPLALDWSRPKFRLLPRLENADIRDNFPPTASRLDLWLRASVGVVGRAEWIFVKLHTHGAPENNAKMLLGEPMRRFHEDLARYAPAHDNFRYYYVTAHEMALLVRQAEEGVTEPDLDSSIVADRSD